MIVTLRTERIRTIEQVAAFVAANEPVEFLQPLDRDGAYAFVARPLARLGYRALEYAVLPMSTGAHSCEQGPR